MNRALLVTLLGAAFGSPSAFAAGWDTPILYSAQHMGLGGAAISYVDDPSAMFHNPAGIARTHGLTLMANVSLLVGDIQASPRAEAPLSHTSETITSVAPLIGVSYRIADFIAAGVAFYPVAAAGATYKWDSGGTTFEDKTAVTFLEISPGVAFKLPGNITLGVGWRATLLSLERYFGPSNRSPGTATFDTELSGTNFVGFRFGAQWEPIPELEIGLVFRTKTTTEIEDTDGATAISPLDKLETEFVLPAKLGFGVRGNIDPISVMLDLEYTLQSQNQQSEFKGEPDLVLPVVSVFDWKDSITARFGVEYNLESEWFFRLGYIFDSQVNRKKYPSAFGTPPTFTNTITAGFGYKMEQDWKLNFALAHRFGSTDVKQTDLNTDQTQPCLPCSIEGDYAIGLTGVYLDFAYSFN